MKAVWAFLVGVGLLSAQAPVPDVDGLRARLDAYLLDYEPQLSALIAEEHFVQQVGPEDPATARIVGPTRRINRDLISEVAFISLPGDTGWLGFRRVVKVDGKALKDAGPTLAQVLTDGAHDDYDEARLLLSESARYNLGTERTTNLPNLPLEVLRPRHRQRFAQRIGGDDSVGGRLTLRLELDEVTRPTLIQRPDGGDVITRVTAWVEPLTGRLMRAEVRTRDARVAVASSDTVLRVEFREDATLRLLVPVEMKEEFFVGGPRRGSGRATYANYRPFVATP